MLNQNKMCVFCYVEKPISEFYKDNGHKDGTGSYCKECTKKKTNNWYHSNKDRAHVREAANWANPKRRAKNKQNLVKWLSAVPDRKKKLDHEYYERNKERIKAKTLGYYYNNKEHILEAGRALRKKNPLRYKINATVAKQRRRALERGLGEKITKQEIAVTFQVFEYKCFNCGTTEKLSVDHFNPLSRGYVLSLNNAIILCVTCNTSKLVKSPEDFFTPLQFKRAQILMAKAEKLYNETIKQVV